MITHARARGMARMWLCRRRAGHGTRRWLDPFHGRRARRGWQRSLWPLRGAIDREAAAAAARRLVAVALSRIGEDRRGVVRTCDCDRRPTKVPIDRCIIGHQQNHDRPHIRRHSRPRESATLVRLVISKIDATVFGLIRSTYSILERFALVDGMVYMNLAARHGFVRQTAD